MTDSSTAAHLGGITPHAKPQLLVVCLCAQWCGTCRDYRAAFDSLPAAFPAHRFRWLDIEDESELAGDIDIETFPTLLLARVDTKELLFAGPVLPRVADARRLIEALDSTIQSAGRPAPIQLPTDQLDAFKRAARRLLGA